MAKRDPFITIDSIEVNGEQLTIHPLKLKDAPRVQTLFGKFNPEEMTLVFLYDETRKAATEVVKLATELSDEEIENFTTDDFSEIINEYIGLSKLKKKMEV